MPLPSLSALPFLPRALGFPTADDERHLDEAVQALLQQRRHVALSGQDSAQLARWSRRLVAQLEQAPGVQLQTLPAGGTQHLVDRINAQLADIPLGALVEPHGPEEPLARVFVVHAGNGVPRAPLAVLARLSRDLPGARIRIVLIQEAETAPGPALSLLGARALHWEVGGRSRPQPSSRPAGPAHAEPPAAAMPARPRPQGPARPGNARRERLILAAGAVTSAVLASALAWVLATHQPALQALARTSSLQIAK